MSKKVIVDCKFELIFPEENGNEHNDEGQIAEIGLLNWLSVHAEWIKAEHYSVGSMIVEDEKVEIKL